jgi:stearoyl-CoA desaturase (delta-9 desaturase)
MLKKIRRLPLPEGVALRKIDWVGVLTICSVHLLAMLACLPWLFNWSSLWVMVAGVFVFGYLGINLFYHRLLTHKGLVCPKWLEHTFALLAVCCVQDTPARWVGIHRWHHIKSDESDDPHTPLAGLAWGHVGWVFLKNDQIDRDTIYTRFAKDILRDPFYKRLETTARYPLIIVASWGLFFSVGFAIELLWGGSFVQAIQFGLSLLIWGVFVRTVVVWHVTWSVNSLAHVFGYRNYDTSDDSRNNWFVALMTLGEGWHNNHHADARSSRHGHRWFEIDLTFSVIQLLEYVGLATNVIRPSKRLNDDKKLNVVG